MSTKSSRTGIPITGIRQGRIAELLARGSVEIDWYSQHPEARHQWRQEIIRANLSDPFKPYTPLTQQERDRRHQALLRARSHFPELFQRENNQARVRTYTNPTQLKAAATVQSSDPQAGFRKARLETPRERARRLGLNFLYDPLWKGFPGTSDRQPDGDAYLVDARHRDWSIQYAITCERNTTKRYPSSITDRSLTPYIDCRPIGEPGRIGKPAIVTVKARRLSKSQREALADQLTALHTQPYVTDTVVATQEPLQGQLRPCKLPRVLPLPDCSTGPLANLTSFKAKPEGVGVTARPKVIRPRQFAMIPYKAPLGTKTVLIASAVIKGEPVIFTDWTPATRKKLYNRIPIQSRSARKRGFRLVARNPDTHVYAIAI